MAYLSVATLIGLVCEHEQQWIVVSPQGRHASFDSVQEMTNG